MRISFGMGFWMFDEIMNHMQFSTVGKRFTVTNVNSYSVSFLLFVAGIA